MSENQPAIDISEILRYLPHRYPFLLIDRVTEIVHDERILAIKNVRDHLMLQYAEQFPAYGFERHMGYGTAVHMAALREHGPCEIHRRSFAPVARVLTGH